MRTFHALVFDDTLDSSTPLYIDSHFNDMLGGLEELTIVGVAVALSGSAPTLSVQIEESPNQVYWKNKAVSPEINAASVSLSTFTNVVGFDTGTNPSSGFVRLRVEVAGSSPRVQVKLWVTGRVETPS